MPNGLHYLLLLGTASLASVRAKSASSDEPTPPDAPAQSAVMVLPPDLLGKSSATPCPFAVQPAGFCAVAEAPSGLKASKAELTRARRAEAKELATKHRGEENARMDVPKGAVNNGVCTDMEWQGGLYSGNCHQYKPHGRGHYQDGRNQLKGTWDNGVFRSGMVLIYEDKVGTRFWEGTFDSANLEPSPQQERLNKEGLSQFKTGYGTRRSVSDKFEETGFFKNGHLITGTRNRAGHIEKVVDFEPVTPPSAHRVVPVPVPVPVACVCG